MLLAPVPGLQLLLAGWLALVLRLNPAVTMLASNVSFGPLLAGWFALEVVVGDGLRRGSWHAAGVRLADLHRELLDHGPGHALPPLLADWLTGALVVMPAVGLLAAGAGFVIARSLRRRQD
jgi:hypothetical protein